MRIPLDRTAGCPSRHLARIPILALTMSLLCGLAASRVPAGSREHKGPDQPIYLDSAEGLRRLEESHVRESFVPLSMYFETQVTQTVCGVATAPMVLNALVRPIRLLHE
jgi:hypothetical protein